MALISARIGLPVTTGSRQGRAGEADGGRLGEAGEQAVGGTGRLVLLGDHERHPPQRRPPDRRRRWRSRRPPPRPAGAGGRPGRAPGPRRRPGRRWPEVCSVSRRWMPRPGSRVIGYPVGGTSRGFDARARHRRSGWWRGVARGDEGVGDRRGREDVAGRAASGDDGEGRAAVACASPLRGGGAARAGGHRAAGPDGPRSGGGRRRPC